MLAIEKEKDEPHFASLLVNDTTVTAHLVNSLYCKFMRPFSRHVLNIPMPMSLAACNG